MIKSVVKKCNNSNWNEKKKVLDMNFLDYHLKENLRWVWPTATKYLRINQYAIFTPETVIDHPDSSKKVEKKISLNQKMADNIKNVLIVYKKIG